MFEDYKVLISPHLNSKDLQFKGMELDEIIEYVLSKGYKEEDFLYESDDFDPHFVELLKKDRELLIRLNNLWKDVNEDPKLDKFISRLDEFTSPAINPTGKLVIFSESVDTVSYLYAYLTQKLGKKDVLNVSASNRKQVFEVIKTNFDANVDIANQKDDYSIIITSDVLAEGINLHRSNVIVNYDSPWNASRLMQRIGRVNRIGSVAESIYNYMFYPSQQGDKEIQLYKNALIKLQGFHSAFGEDAQIYSREEIVKNFRLFDSNVRDVVDKKIALLRELRNLYNNNREWYNKIKALPMKSRVLRDTGKHCDTTIVYVSTKIKSEFYKVLGQRHPEPIDFLKAVDYLKAKPEEVSIPFAHESATLIEAETKEMEAAAKNGNNHYIHVNRAVSVFSDDLQAQTDIDSIQTVNLDKTAQTADKFLRTVQQACRDDASLIKDCGILRNYIKEGTYARLPRELKTISQEYKNDRMKMKADSRVLANRISTLIAQYHNSENVSIAMAEIGMPSIVLSETFL